MILVLIFWIVLHFLLFPGEVFGCMISYHYRGTFAVVISRWEKMSTILNIIDDDEHFNGHLLS